MEKVTINAIELASELAHMKVYELSKSKVIYIEDESGTTYTDEAQDIFNEYYDEYLTLIDQCKF
jgi:hypothetical protein